MTMSDADALDKLAAFMARPGQWNGGDVCEVAANVIIATGRPSPSGEIAGDGGDEDAEADSEAPPEYLAALAARRGQELDTSSSASRQHYIDTGQYLKIGEANA